ncbi:tetratricopeptide repeat protein [Verrucomicrobia bacterium S94]|nr:tetratricopeptide repeat protein [Verrucomicrobia bacterium S94]
MKSIIIPCLSFFLFSFEAQCINAEGIETISKIQTETIPADLLKSIHIKYPFNHAVFPPDIVAPSFQWHDESNSRLWLMLISSETLYEPLRIFCDGKNPEPVIDPKAVSPLHNREKLVEKNLRSWRPDPKTWEIIKKNSRTAPLKITIYGFRNQNATTPLSSGTVTINTSEDPVNAPVFYRDVPLMPSQDKSGSIKPIAADALDLIKWKLRDISKENAVTVLSKMPTCANCHSFSTDGKYLGMDLDGPDGDKGAYTIVGIAKNITINQEDIISWNAFEGSSRNHENFGLFSQISPDGRYVISTLNESVYVENFADARFIQAFYPTRGILVFYDTETGQMKPLPGASSPQYVQTNAVWTPDGKTLIFSRASAKDKYEHKRRASFPGDKYETQIQYDLYSIPFNEGKGGKAVPIKGASNNGMSNSFPKVSPDGKWIVFVQSKNGQLLRPDSRLYIVPVEGGDAREMNCNLDLMNSWHSWSPNGKWLVFSSKGLTPFTQMFLTHIDRDGTDTPPVLIPNSTAANRAVNIPEFVNAETDVIQSIKAPTQQSYKLNNEGVKLGRSGRYTDALFKFEQSIELNPYFAEAHIHRGVTLLRLKRYREAEQSLRKALELKPDDENAHFNMGAVLESRDLPEAVQHYEHLLVNYPYLDQIRSRLIEIYLAQQNYTQIISHADYFLEARPENIELRNLLGIAYFKLGAFKKAEKQLQQALKHNPDKIPTLINYSWCLASDPQATASDRAQAIQLALHAKELTGGNQAGILDAVAYAYAANKQYDKALTYAMAALNLAENERNTALKDQLSRRIKQYRQQNTSTR